MPTALRSPFVVRCAAPSATTSASRRSPPPSGTRCAGGTPLVSHAFLCALHETGCASAATGWTPRYLTAWRGDALAGALPLYAKTHSYGEYVFDWAWADAYRRHGRRYYPKLVAAIPFTPAPGPRLFAADDAARTALHPRGARRCCSRARRGGDPPYSSLHVLFPTEDEVRALEAAGMIVRHGLQFRWENPGYRDFADFLATFNHDKRKKVKQERRKVADAGVMFTRKTGERDHRRGLGVLPPLLRRHLSRSSLDAVPQSRILRAHRRRRSPAT